MGDGRSLMKIRPKSKAIEDPARLTSSSTGFLKLNRFLKLELKLELDRFLRLVFVLVCSLSTPNPT